MKKNLRLIFALFLIAGIPDALRAQEITSDRIKKDGFYFGAAAGTWLGTGRSSILGNPLLAGLVLELKSGKGALALNFDLITSIGKTDTLYLKKDNAVLKANKYFGAQFGLEYSRELYGKNRFAIEAVGGAGYGAISFKGSDAKDYDRSSLYINPGLGMRYFVTGSTFIQLKFQYNMVDYKIKEKDGTDVSGNLITTKLILGWK